MTADAFRFLSRCGWCRRDRGRQDVHDLLPPRPQQVRYRAQRVTLGVLDEIADGVASERVARVTTILLWKDHA